MKNSAILCLFVFLFVSAFDNNVLAQNKPKTKPKTNNQTKATDSVIKSDEVVEEAPPSLVSAYSYPTEEGRFRYERINDIWSLVYDKLSNNYNTGLAKNGKIVLPVIFKSSTYNDRYLREQKKIILSIDNNYGIYDLDKTKWHIPLSYSHLSVLDNSFILAKKQDNYGIIDFENKTIVNFEWNSISSIDEANYVIVKNKQDLYGILNILNSKLVMPCIYKNVTKMDQSSSFLVTNFAGQKTLVSLNNQPIFKNWYDEITNVYKRRNFIVKKSGKYGIIDDQEKVILPLEYNMIRSYPYNDGSYLSQNSEGKFGCVTLDGKITLPFEYDQLNDGSGQSILISVKEKKCGIVQVNQGLPTEILTCDYDDIRVNQQSFIISKGGKFGLLDNYGKIIAPLEFDMITIANDRDYSKSSLYIAQKDNRYVLLNSSGQKITSQSYKSLSKLSELSTEYYSSKTQCIKFVADNNKVGVLDFYGQELIPAIYDEIESISKSNIVYRQNQYLGLYNYINKKEIASPTYDQILLTKNGFIALKGNEIYELNTSDPSHHKKLN